MWVCQEWLTGVAWLQMSVGATVRLSGTAAIGRLGSNVSGRAEPVALLRIQFMVLSTFHDGAKVLVIRPLTFLKQVTQDEAMSRVGIPGSCADTIWNSPPAFLQCPLAYFASSSLYRQ